MNKYFVNSGKAKPLWQVDLEPSLKGNLRIVHAEISTKVKLLESDIIKYRKETDNANGGEMDEAV